MHIQWIKLFVYLYYTKIKNIILFKIEGKIIKLTYYFVDMIVIVNYYYYSDIPEKGNNPIMNNLVYLFLNLDVFVWYLI
jgi:hypothetical protein